MAPLQWLSVVAAWVAGSVADARTLQVWCITHPFSPLENLIRLATELRSRGHNASVGSTDKAQLKVRDSGLHFLNLGKHPISVEKELALLFETTQDPHPLASLSIGKPLFDDVDRAMQESLAQLAANNNQSLPDILVCSPPSSSCAAFAAEHKIPFVWSLPKFAVLNPVFTQFPYVPAMVMDLPYGRMTAWQRLLNLWPTVYYSLVLPLKGWPNNALRECAANLRGRLILIPSVPGLDYPQHTPPLVQYTGPFLARQDFDAGLLREDVRAWLNQPGAHPVLYISMGTVVQLSEKMCQVFLEAVRQGAAAGEFRALWALPANQQRCLGPDRAERLRGPGGPLLVTSWVPTPAALAHPAVRAFLSHGGANGGAEAAFARVPVLGLPFFGDQAGNIHRLSDLGLALRLDRRTVTPRDVREGVRRLLTEPRFAAAARRVEQVLKVYGGVSRAADLVEMVHGLGGDLRFLETAVDRQGPLRAYCFDLLLATVAVLACGCFACGRCSSRVSQGRARGSHPKAE